MSIPPDEHRERRDEQLGRELRALEVPDHGPDFFVRLAQRLEQEAPRAIPVRPAIWRRPPVIGMVAAAVILAIVAISAQFVGNGPGSLRPGPTEPTLISATEVRARVSNAFSSLQTLSGQVTIECAIYTGSCAPPDGGGRTTQEWSFVTTAAGDERVTGIGRTDDLAYNAARREQTSVSDDGRLTASAISNLPPGPPDFAAQRSVLRRDVASVVRAFLDTTGEVPVTEVSEQGRAAWRLVDAVEPNKLAGPGASGDQLEVLVDRQSGFPLRITETLAGSFLNEVRLSNLVVDGPVDPALFVFQPPAGAKTFRQSAGFRSITLGEAAAIVKYQPLLPAPTSLPPGYRLAEVTVAANAQPTGSEGANPASRGVVSVAYRRGFDRIVVTTRSVGTTRPCVPESDGSGPTCWADPVASGEGFRDQPQSFTVTDGDLAGAQANLVISPRGVPHVWTIDDRLVVTVAGDASAQELRQMAESFAPAGPGN